MNIKLLQSRLSEFGLNPNDWSIDIIRELGQLRCLQIRPEAEQPFEFIGWAINDCWLDINFAN